MKIKAMIGVGLAAMMIAAPGVALAKKGGDSAADRARAKLGSALNMVSAQADGRLPARPATGASNVVLDSGVGKAVVEGRGEIVFANVTADGYVVMDAVAVGDGASLAATMRGLGARKVTARGKIVSAEMPANRLDDLAAASTFAYGRPVFAATDSWKKARGPGGSPAPNFGLVQGQNDRSMGTDIVRDRFGLTGKGLKIGILSDSFDCDFAEEGGGGFRFTNLEEDIANGDLPSKIQIIADYNEEGCIDEGRAMAQLIHDVLPDAEFAYHTAFGGEADFAQGIIDLIEVGSDVIVDDVIYFSEPMFQDGIIAQAADEANRLGIPYYSSNGNRARDALQSEYRPVPFQGSTFHDWDPGPGVAPTNLVLLGGALQTNLTLQWDSPNFSISGPPGAQNDVDLVMFDTAGNRVPDCFEFLDANGFFPDLCQFKFTDSGLPIDGGNGGDAVELVSLVDFGGGSVVRLGVETQAGAPPGLFKYVLFGGSLPASQFPVRGSPSGFGHNNAAGAEGVGASAFYFTEAFIGDPNTLPLRAIAAQPECRPACLNDFSSAGGTPILFDLAGNRLPTPDVRFKPGLTAPDGINNSFFIGDTSRDDDDGDGFFTVASDPDGGEFPNFFGTSAAAPNAAAVAALMIEAEGSQLRVPLPGSDRIFMCKPFRNNKNRFGVTIPVRLDTAKIRQNIDKGYLMGKCTRSTPETIREVMRATSDDMTVRASNGTGATIQIFDEVGPAGFDFDSGFGFVNAVAAVETFAGPGQVASKK